MMMKMMKMMKMMMNRITMFVLTSGTVDNEDGDGVEGSRMDPEKRTRVCRESDVCLYDSVEYCTGRKGLPRGVRASFGFVLP